MTEKERIERLRQALIDLLSVINLDKDGDYFISKEAQPVLVDARYVLDIVDVEELPG